jgi:hypothetical protein
MSVYSVNKFKYYILLSPLGVNAPMQLVTLIGLFLIFIGICFFKLLVGRVAQSV